MSEVKNTFVTPIGRIVEGHLGEPQITDREGKACDPNWYVGLAVPKGPEADAFIAHIKRVAESHFSDKPNQVKRHDFAWKYTDGDSTEVNQKGVVWNTKNGYPGNIIFRLSTNFAFKTCTQEDPSVSIDAKATKRGDYVRIAGNIRGNGRDDKPGVYLNLTHGQFVRSGEEISNKASCAAVFGGASAPAHDIVNNATGAAPPPPPPAPPGVSKPLLTAAGRKLGLTDDNWNGWTEDQLRAKGYLVPDDDDILF